MPSLKSYIIGFILSVTLTLAAYFSVVNHSAYALWIIMVLAFIQLIVQLIFFLHLHQGTDRPWNLAIFFSTASIIFIVVVGSLWIMNHLNYNMSPQQMNEYLMKMEGMGVEK